MHTTKRAALATPLLLSLLLVGGCGGHAASGSSKDAGASFLDRGALLG